MRVDTTQLTSKFSVLQFLRLCFFVLPLLLGNGNIFAVESIEHNQNKTQNHNKNQDQNQVQNQIPVPPQLYKIISEKEWLYSQSEGCFIRSATDLEFIYLAEKGQISQIIHKVWKAEKNIAILTLETKKLKGKLVKEKNFGGSTEYFHLYEGEIPLNAIIEVKIVHQD